MLVPGLSMRLAPPTSAMSLSRRRRLWQARWIATSDDEHAVSTTIAGPRAPRKYANRPAAKFAAFPVGYVGVEILGPQPGRQREHVVVGGQTDEHGGLRTADSVRMGCRRPPTPPRPPRGASRCCGSIAAASRGEMAKNSASNSSGCQEVRKPSFAVADRPRHGVVVRVVPVGVPPFGAVPATMPLRPFCSNSQYCSGLFTPPGNRHRHSDDGDGLGARLLGDSRRASDRRSCGAPR